VKIKNGKYVCEYDNEEDQYYNTDEFYQICNEYVEKYDRTVFINELVNKL